MRILPQLCVSVAGLVLVTGIALAQQRSFDINRISDSGVGEKIGTATVAEVRSGVTFKITVPGLPKGQHGFHVHEKGDCGPATKDGKMTAGVAAGDHFDPDGRNTHRGPRGKGHKGDLPKLTATDKGIDQTVTAPRLKLADIAGRAVIIHEVGDTYTDRPENGGGKGRIACGVIP